MIFGGVEDFGSLVEEKTQDIAVFALRISVESITMV